MRRYGYQPPKSIVPGSDNAGAVALGATTTTTATETGPLVLEWLDSETLEWGETTLTRTVGNADSVADNGIIDVPPIVEYARLRNAPVDADVEWSLTYETVAIPGDGTSAAYTTLTTRWSGAVESLDGVLSATAGVIVPLYVVQPVYTDPSPVFTKTTAVSLVELSATYNGVSYGPIYLIITGQSYYTS